jgi:molybdopterin/thiamine biosynthesis adenylyltransferase/rhodanese-related sulfurtransferase
MVKNDLSNSELKRYARHLVLPEVGEDGQKKLKSAKVLIIGAGGLGSPLGLYLASAGVGEIGVIDFDNVSFSNLQRQVLFSENKVGKSKAEIAKEHLLEINSGITVKAYNEKLTYKNAPDIIKNYDIVADGSDNFSAKYLVNDACVLLGKPLVYGSVLRFEGQVSVFIPEEGPCYRCLYPEPPDGGNVLTCEEAGVLGALPGIIGSIQANEVIKLIIGKGETLAGRLLVLNSLKMKFREIKFEKNPDCPVCGKNPVIKSLSEELYDFESCTPAEDENFKSEITVDELKKKIDNKESFFLIDVREPIETRISSIGGELIPLKDLPQRINELNKDEEIIVYCRTGHRSHNAVQFLREKAGFKKVRNLLGGINLWAEKIDNSLQKY